MLREMIEAARNRKKRNRQDGGGGEKDDGKVLTGQIPFVPVAIEGLFSGTEGSLGIGLAGGGSARRGPADTSTATLADVIAGKRSIQEYIRQHRPSDLVKELSQLLSSKDAIARLASAARVSVKTAENVIRAIVAALRSGVK